MTDGQTIFDKIEFCYGVVDDWAGSTQYDRQYVRRTLAEAYRSIDRLRGALVASGVSYVQVDWITDDG